MDVVQYQDFLKSLAEVSQWQFEVRDHRGPVFATASGGPPSDMRERLAAAIMTGERIYVQRGGEGFLTGVPLRGNEAPMGALLAWHNGIPNGTSADPETMEPFLLRLTEVLGERWIANSELVKITEELSKSYEDVYLYGRLSSLIKSMHFSYKDLGDLIGEIRDAVDADLVFVTLNRDHRRIIKQSPLIEQKQGGADFVDRLLGAVSAEKPSSADHYIIINDSRSVPGYRNLHDNPFRALLVSMLDGKKFYGWIGVISFNMERIFRRSELRLIISIADQVSVVITNTDLYNELEQFIMNTVKCLVNAIESKDTYTRGHSERVSRFSLHLAEKMGLDKEQTGNLQWAAILHDVGKIGISEAILNKSAPLLAEEYDQIKRHPTEGYTILKPLAPLAGALPGILHHHERYDGKGYPDGLAGEEIPLLGRIIAVTDTFDAIRSNRAYRMGVCIESVMNVMKSVSGTQLDGHIVETFSEIIAGDKAIAMREGEGTGEERQ